MIEQRTLAEFQAEWYEHANRLMVTLKMRDGEPGLQVFHARLTYDQANAIAEQLLDALADAEPEDE